MTQPHRSLFRPVPPLFFVLSGPSGVGKDVVLTLLKSGDTGIRFITTMTTRPRRPMENDGIDYRFVSPETFADLLKKNELLEHANVYGHWYGVPKQAVRDALKAGRDTMVKVDVQGAASIKKIIPEAVFIFLMPPSLAELGKRLRQRYTETPPELEVRLKAAAEEMERRTEFDYIVMNSSGGIKQAAADIRAIITAEKCRVTPRQIQLP